MNVHTTRRAAAPCIRPPAIAVETPAEVEPTVEIETPVDEVTSLDSVRLPDTASGLPLIGLLGLVVVSGGVAVRVARP